MAVCQKLLLRAPALGRPPAPLPKVSLRRGHGQWELGAASRPEASGQAFSSGDDWVPSNPDGLRVGVW